MSVRLQMPTLIWIKGEEDLWKWSTIMFHAMRLLGSVTNAIFVYMPPSYTIFLYHWGLAFYTVPEPQSEWKEKEGKIEAIV